MFDFEQLLFVIGQILNSKTPTVISYLFNLMSFASFGTALALTLFVTDNKT